MKLSEAILRGCEMTPKQAFDSMGKAGRATCALGAAIEGAGYSLLSRIYDCFPEITEEIFDQVIFLNDEDQWSRERIAGWLAEKGL